MYAARVPNLTIYVDADLAADLKFHEVPLSRTCQAALRRKVRAAERAAYDSTYRERLRGVRASQTGGHATPAA